MVERRDYRNEVCRVIVIACEYDVRSLLDLAGVENGDCRTWQCNVVKRQKRTLKDA